MSLARIAESETVNVPAILLMTADDHLHEANGFGPFLLKLGAATN